MTNRTTTIDIRTANGWYRREVATVGGFVTHLYCSDNTDEWTILDGSRGQADIDHECKDAIAEAAKKADAKS